MSKICCDCHLQLNVEDFYTYTKKDNTLGYYNKCYKCHNKNQYRKKGAGIKKLPLDTQEQLKKELMNRNVKLIDLAEKYHIKYTTLGY